MIYICIDHATIYCHSRYKSSELGSALICTRFPGTGVLMGYDDVSVLSAVRKHSRGNGGNLGFCLAPSSHRVSPGSAEMSGISLHNIKKGRGSAKKVCQPSASFHYYPDGTLLHQDLAAFAILGKNDVHSSLK